jgi:Tfp pilus assembly protein PilX
MLIRIRSDERGVAMITALMITFVVASLALVVINLSIHNVTQSNYDRKRVQSVNAAEAGVDYTWSAIEQTAPDQLPWTPASHSSSFTGTLGTGPGSASFTSTVQYFDSTQTAITTQPSQTNVPAYAEITSVGQTNSTVPRTLQSFVKLTPIRQGIQAAVLINSSASFANNFTINGDQGNDGDVHIENGNLTISNQPNIYGSVYVSNGTMTLQNGITVHGNAWSWGSMSVQNPAAILGYGRSSSSSISSNGSIGGDATAGTTIAASLHVSGSSYPNSPTTAHPPAVSFPLVCWDTAGSCTGSGNEYTADRNPADGQPDYNVVNFSDCVTARTYLVGTTAATPISGNTVVRINAVCDLSILNNDKIYFNGNLVIFTNGSITMNNQNNWNGQNNNALAFIVNYQTIFPASCSSSYNITTSNNSNFNNVYVSFYSPCTITIANQNAFTGQVMGQTVNITNNTTINYKPVQIPGIGKIVGFQQDVVYEREIPS